MPAPSPLEQPDLHARRVGEASSGVVGDAGSAKAVGRLKAALERLKAASAKPHLDLSVRAMTRFDWTAASQHALRALEADPKCGLGWHLLGIAREKCSDFVSALDAYEAALALLPDEREIAADLGRLAYRLGKLEIAEKLFLHYLLRAPGDVDTTNNVACAIRDQGRFDEAIEVLRPVIQANPQTALLWNTLGSCLSEQGQSEASVTFYQEALRLDPGFAKARYNLANVYAALGDPASAVTEIDVALSGAESGFERAMMRFARATHLIASGDLQRGWDAYEARLDPDYAGSVNFLIDRPRWTPGADLAGKRLLIVGEQGLGDEVLFANLLPDVIDRVGPDGAVTIAVTDRLVALFQRSFPTATVCEHKSATIGGHPYRAVPALEGEAMAAIDLWTPMASLLREFRSSAADFPSRPSFLAPDPARVAHWRAALDALGPEPKVGILWKSLKTNQGRGRQYSTIDQWLPVLRTPGFRFVNIQYGDTEAEMRFARENGLDVWTPPDIDLKDHLDDVAALCAALDLVVGPANATANIGASVGAQVWMMSPPDTWTRLGTDRMPWFPRMRLFIAPRYGRWGDLLQQIAGDLPKLSGART